MIAEKQKLNILQINTLDGAGGAAKVARQLKDGLKKMGYVSRMLVGNKLNDDPDVETIPTLESSNRWIRSANQRIFKKVSRGLSMQYFDILNSFSIGRRKDFYEADIIHFHNLHGDYLNPLALPGLTRSKKAVYTLHDMWSFTGHCAHSFACARWETGCGQCPDLSIYPALQRDTTHVLWKMKKWIYDWSRFQIVVPSQWLQRKVEKSILAHKKIKLIYNGVDETIFRPQNSLEMRRKLGLPEEGILIACSSHGGVDSVWRSRDLLTRALHRVPKQKMIFLNIGAGEHKIENALGKVAWIDVPHLTDETKMAEYLAAADIFLYPTLADNCPLGVLEAMACGLPVVSFDVGGIPELVDHGRTGYLAKPKDAQDLTQGLMHFILNPAAKNEAGAYARKKIENRFTLAKMIEAYVELYDQLLT